MNFRSGRCKARHLSEIGLGKRSKSYGENSRLNRSAVYTHRELYSATTATRHRIERQRWREGGETSAVASFRGQFVTSLFLVCSAKSKVPGWRPCFRRLREQLLALCRCLSEFRGRLEILHSRSRSRDDKFWPVKQAIVVVTPHSLTNV